MEGTGSTFADGGLTIGSPGVFGSENLVQYTLVNDGQATLAGSGWSVTQNGTIMNAPNAQFFIADDVAIGSDGSGGTFWNEGTLFKTGGVGESVILTSLTNSGTVLAEFGTLLFVAAAWIRRPCRWRRRRVRRWILAGARFWSRPARRGYPPTQGRSASAPGT